MLNVVKEKLELSPDLEKEIIKLTKQKERIKQAYMSGIVEIEDFKEDVRIINQKIDTISKQIDNNKYLNSKSSFTPEKAIARIFLETNYDSKIFLNEWDMKTKEEKQEFVAKYIESMTFKRDENSKYKIKINFY